MPRTTLFDGISNPFVMSAIASSLMDDARRERPVDCHCLHKLQREIDNFTTEVGAVELVLRSCQSDGRADTREAI